MKRALLLFLVVAALAALAAGTAVGLLWWLEDGEHETRPETLALIQVACASCHLLPTPDILPRSCWAFIIDEMFSFAADDEDQLAGLERDDVRHYFESNAPELLTSLPLPSAKREGGLDWKRKRFAAAPGAPPTPAVSHLQFARLFDSKRLDIVMCDMRHGFVMALRPYDPDAQFIQLAVAGNPVHADVTDLDANGSPDIVVSNLGTFEREDHDKGSVEWLRPAGRKWERVTLQAGLGRVADARAADFDGDGDLDIVVAEFGWRETGSVILLENTAGSGATPRFAKRELDPRHGSIHVPIADLDGDGRPDFVVLISQEHEVIEAFLNRGGLEFEVMRIHQAPHPAWGSSGIEVVDLDADGDHDVLYTNGDTLDDYELKPYQAVRWLENEGSFPFTERVLAPYYGVNRAVPADLDGDGDLDIVASAFLPHLPEATHRRPMKLSGVIWLEQTSPGRFERRTLEAFKVDHPALAAGDHDGDGDIDLVVGNFSMQLGDWDRLPNWVTLWTQE